MKNQLKISFSVFCWRNVFICLILSFTACKKKEPVLSLPVYEVVQTDVGDTTIGGLPGKLKIPVNRLIVKNGLGSFSDPAKYLVVPNHEITDPKALNELKKLPTAKGGPVKYTAFDFDALKKTKVLGSSTALTIAAQAFKAAGLHVDSTKALVGHTTFTYYDLKDKSASFGKQLDTRVNYEFYNKSGYQFTGPGAHFSVTFNSDSTVGQLNYAWRNLKTGRVVSIIPESEAKKRVASLLPQGAKINLKLVYWCPALADGAGKEKVMTIIPWYSFNGTIEKKNANGSISKTTTGNQFMPATDDTAFVPRANLTVTGQNTDRVNASATVIGGQPPYKYTWSGSSPALSLTNSASVSYQPRVRALDTIATQSINENVSVVVTDANGIEFHVPNYMIPVIAHPLYYITANHIPGPPSGALPTFGCESPGDLKWPTVSAKWESSMNSSAGGTEAFCWRTEDSWAGDYIEPPMLGKLPANPWIYGDADYANWGINTANLVMIIGDGYADSFTVMHPGTNANFRQVYNVLDFLCRPGNPAGTVSLPIPTDFTHYNVNYNGCWGQKGPNDRLYWLTGLLCECLDSLDPSGLTTAQRWGPAFGGLHIFTGFASTVDVTADFPQDFAQDILGTNASQVPLTIQQAWFDAANTNGIGTAAAMGPVTGMVNDFSDYYFGQGTQGPDISGEAITGWWYITSNSTVLTNYTGNQ